MTPNFNELQAIYWNLCEDQSSSSRLIQKDQTEGYGRGIFEKLPNLHSLYVTIDKDGVVFVGYKSDLDHPIQFGPESILFKQSDLVQRSKQITCIHFPQQAVPNVVSVSGAGDW
ncbi:hypothetical protein QR98_0022450 [Sarcoptes scabiei]|uniref:Uncharacterized protein n=1 Tax=Sarcoptes scabiei TaxID=52283 RepID=A0A132A0D0_SARSC|nr:hypothetical protein QR98_0022450 [Sarcoptes scabiei]